MYPGDMLLKNLNMFTEIHCKNLSFVGSQLIFFSSLLGLITPYNVCSVHRGCSVHQRVFSTSGGYHEYIGGYYEYIGGIL